MVRRSFFSHVAMLGTVGALTASCLGDDAGPVSQTNPMAGSAGSTGSGSPTTGSGGTGSDTTATGGDAGSSFDGGTPGDDSSTTADGAGGAGGQPGGDAGHPGLWDLAGLARIQKQASQGALKPAYDSVISEAEKALSTDPFSVMNKTKTAPSGDKHDYLSLARYWWPDPNN